MKLFPAERFSIVSSLPPAELEEAIQVEIARMEALRNHIDDHVRFEGYVAHYYLRLSKISPHRHNARIVIEGDIEQDGSGSRVDVRMGPPGGFYIVVSVLILVALLGVGIVLFGLFSQQIEPEPMLIIPFMMLFGGFVVGWIYRCEVNRLQPAVIEMFRRIHVDVL